MQSLILEIKMIYSIEIMNQISHEKRQYFLDLTNSIPDNVLETKNPIEAIKNGKKLKSFIYHLNEELKEEGMDMSLLKEKLNEFNSRCMKALKIPNSNINKIKGD